MTVDTQDHLLQPGMRLGAYEVLSFVGEGASAMLYQVRRVSDGAIFAAKVLRPTVAQSQMLREKFAAEAAILKRLRHPNIVRLVDDLVIDETTLHAFVMEFVDGSTLEQYLPLHPGGLSEVLTLRLAWQIADALNFAHSKGVVHRDIKPENILIEQREDGSLGAFVADFGLAKVFNAQHRTATGLRLGTLAYMPPEQIEDSSKVDARADIYALGITIYECLTASLPFPEYSIQEVIAAQQQRVVPSVRNQRIDLSSAWDEIIAKACAKDREARYRSAGLLLRDLGALARALEVDDRTTRAVAPVSSAPPAMRSEGARVTRMAAGPPPRIPSPARGQLRPLPHMSMHFGDTLDDENLAQLVRDTLSSENAKGLSEAPDPDSAQVVRDTLSSETQAVKEPNLNEILVGVGPTADASSCGPLSDRPPDPPRSPERSPRREANPVESRASIEPTPGPPLLIIGLSLVILALLVSLIVGLVI